MARRRDADDFGLAPAATARSACGAAAGNGDLVVGGGLIVREIVGVLLAPLHAGETFSYWPALTCIGLLGLGTALLRPRTGSLVPPLFMHFVYNLGACPSNRLDSTGCGCSQLRGASSQ